ncbi:hypothetical protein KAR91_46540 [Candidatus Pacearchaeota archaeon]|nr:hypothetical protein [Candidatus Pacearchaeota archaeon]
MGEVVNLLKNKPHMTGEALCIGCGHKWVCVAPTGTIELKCSECGTWKGVFEGCTAPETVYECDCGNQHFYVDECGPMCALCGLRMD